MPRERLRGKAAPVVVPCTCESSALSCAVKAATSLWRDEIDDVAGDRDGVDVAAIVGATDVPIEPTIGPLPPPPPLGAGAAGGPQFARSP